jgi:hypothetical protein
MLRKNEFKKLILVLTIVALKTSLAIADPSAQTLNCNGKDPSGNEVNLSMTSTIDPTLDRPGYSIQADFFNGNIVVYQTTDTIGHVADQDKYYGTDSKQRSLLLIITHSQNGPQYSIQQPVVAHLTCS